MVGAIVGDVVSPTSLAMEKLLEHLTGDGLSTGGDVGGSCAPMATDGHSSSVMFSDECELDALLGRDFLRFSTKIE